MLLCASRLRVILKESVQECLCPHFGRLEEVCKFLLLWWRFIALVTADADYITAVREMGSIARRRDRGSDRLGSGVLKAEASTSDR